MNVWKEIVAQNPAIWLVAARGRLDQNLTPILEETLNQLITDGCYHLIVDLQEINYINSGGLRCLVSAWRKTRQQGGNLVLCGLNERLQEIFSMVGFDKVFSIHPSRSAAKSALQAAA